MRFSTMILGLGSAALVAVGTMAAGCGGDGGGTGGGGNASSSSSSSGATSSSGGTCTYECCPDSTVCKAADLNCIGLVDNKDQTKFGLRMSQLNVTVPAALTTGIVSKVVASGVAPSNADCNLNGSATFNWLLQFDTTAGTLKTGGAKPVADANAGYAFADEMVTQGGKTFHVQAVTFTGVTPDASGKFQVSTGQDLLVPVYLDAGGTQVVILPLKGARLNMGTLSSNNNCIGHYNAEGLKAADSCLGDQTFVTGASLDGIITLEDADTVIVSPLKQSLCAILSQNVTMYGTVDGNGITVCKRDANNAILFQGDTCSMAGGTCKDAVNLAADFAASSVKIN